MTCIHDIIHIYILLQVLNVKVGHSVFGRQKMERIVKGRGGACAEWCVVEALDVVAKPSNITHEHAAAGVCQNRDV